MLQIPFPNFLDIYIFLTEYLIKLITVYYSILNTIKYLRERERENRIYFIIEIFVIAINNPFYECPKIKNLLIRKAKKKIKEISNLNRILIDFIRCPKKNAETNDRNFKALNVQEIKLYEIQCRKYETNRR